MNTNSDYSTNDKLLEMAQSYAENVIVNVEECPYTPSDAKHLVRDAYYKGFEDFYNTIVIPMRKTFDRIPKDTDNLYHKVYKLALDDIIEASGFKCHNNE